MNETLTDRYSDRLAGTLSCYDRIVITGTLPGACYADGMTSYLNAHHIRIFDYPRFAEPLRDRIRADQRHEDFRVIAEGPLQQRVFNDCGMVLRHVGDSEGSKQPDFSAWQKRKIPFAELADDPRLCYAYITAHAVQG